MIKTDGKIYEIEGEKVKHHGSEYDLGDFMRMSHSKVWHGSHGIDNFGGMVIRLVEDNDTGYVIGRSGYSSRYDKCYMCGADFQKVMEETIEIDGKEYCPACALKIIHNMEWSNDNEESLL